MLESKGGVLMIAGVFFFALAFVSNALVPALMYRDLPEKSAEQLVTANLRYQFEDLARRFPEAFEKHIGKAPEGAEREQWLNDKCAEALRIGRRVYVGEACWHCHSQFVRPVSNESRRWGPVSQSWEYQNELQRPVMFGTRRVGPDLSREGGRRSNDWQAVHLFEPTALSDGTVMPSYPWFFEGSPDKPNRRGLALLTYLQWLGSWLESYPYYELDSASALPADAQPDAAVAAAPGGATDVGPAEGDGTDPASPEEAAPGEADAPGERAPAGTQTDATPADNQPAADSSSTGEAESSPGKPEEPEPEAAKPAPDPAPTDNSAPATTQESQPTPPLPPAPAASPGSADAERPESPEGPTCEPAPASPEGVTP